MTKKITIYGKYYFFLFNTKKFYLQKNSSYIQKIENQEEKERKKMTMKNEPFSFHRHFEISHMSKKQKQQITFRITN